MNVAATVTWTQSQQAGIETTGKSLLVSAAAGSGKTAVLAERCAYLVCDATPPCSVDQLLVVTFTDAAAAEMKGRIGEALSNRLEKKPGDLRLQTQLALIEQAQVSTLHGFCSRLLRQHFHVAGVDPGFRILDGDEASLLRNDVVRDLFEHAFDTDETGQFQHFVDDYGNGNDAELRPMVVRTHELLCSLIDPADWIVSARERLHQAVSGPLTESHLGQQWVAVVRAKFSSLTDNCAAAVRLVAAYPDCRNYGSYLTDLAAVIAEWRGLFDAGRFDVLASAVTSWTAPRKRKVATDAVAKDTVSAAIDAIRDEMGSKGSLRQFIRFTTAEWVTGLHASIPSAEILLDLVTEFGKRYEQAKRRAGGLDFSDLERFALKVLRDETPDGGTPTPVARLYHRRIHYVLVDEYQDINEIQDEILRLVSRECLLEADGRIDGAAGLQQTTTGAIRSNLFAVGDVKQSIYGFRLAEPERFLRREARFRAAPFSMASVIDLQSNFRSRGPLLEGINALFERLMTREAVDIQYDRSHRLEPARHFAPAGADESAFTGAPIEIHLLPAGGDQRHSDSQIDNDSDGASRAAATAPPAQTTDADRSDTDPASDESSDELDRTQREGALIAHRIEELMGHRGTRGMKVFDKKLSAYRDLRYSDIVLLLRSLQFKAEQLADVLRRNGVPVYRDSGSGFFESVEIRDILSLLTLLDNGQQDIPLAAVLRSPLAGLTSPDDALALIRLAYPTGEPPIDFHEAVTRYATEQTDALAVELRAFTRRLTAWRRVALLRPPADLLAAIYDDTGYLSYCSGLENGEQKCANLHHLRDRATQFGTFARQGLYPFLQFLAALRAEKDLGQPSVLGENGDVVRVMSVHKSKGLQFPVVFIPDLGKKINLKSAQGAIMVDRVYQLGLMAIDRVKQVRYPSLASLLVGRRLKQQALAEEMRVLYVAMTRAEEHLELIGTCDAKRPGQWDERWASHPAALPTDVILDSATMLDWIGPAAAAIGGHNPLLYRRTMHSAAEAVRWMRKSASNRDGKYAAQLAACLPLHPRPPADAAADEVIARVAQVYPFDAFTGLRASIPVTEFSKRGPADKILETETVATNPAFTDSNALEQAMPLPPFITESVSAPVELSAADAGTATHLLLQHFDFTRDCDLDDIDMQIESLLRKGLMTPAQAAAIDRGSIAWFAASPLGRTLSVSAAGDVIREIPFNYALSPVEFDRPPTNDPADSVMLRGRIDLLLQQSDGLHVIDYKTDNVYGERLNERKALYTGQVTVYRNAIEQFTGQPVAGVHLVFLTARITASL